MKRTELLLGRTIIMVLLSCSLTLWAQTDVDLIKAGQELRYKGQWEKAYQIYEQVVKTHPDSPYVLRARFYQGHCMFRLGKKRNALDHFEGFLNLAGADHKLTLPAKMAIIDLCEDLGVWNRLEELARDGDFQVRFSAGLGLARGKRNSGVPVLIEALRHPDPKIADRARLFLYVLGDAKGLAAITQIGNRNAQGAGGYLSISISGRNYKGNPVPLVVQEEMGDLLFDLLSPAQKKSLENAGVHRKTMARDMRKQKEVKVQVKGSSDEISLKLVPGPR